MRKVPFLLWTYKNNIFGFSIFKIIFSKSFCQSLYNYKICSAENRLYFYSNNLGIIGSKELDYISNNKV